MVPLHRKHRPLVAKTAFESRGKQSSILTGVMTLFTDSEHSAPDDLDEEAKYVKGRRKRTGLAEANSAPSVCRGGPSAFGIDDLFWERQRSLRQERIRMKQTRGRSHTH
eukprot:scaffold873_cov252-Pinguiococcus_pyrenoidosus.AAC.8